MEGGGVLDDPHLARGLTRASKSPIPGRASRRKPAPHLRSVLHDQSCAEGTGLGLSVTYGIMREHGGSIEVHSDLAAGTLFHLEFPAAPESL